MKVIKSIRDKELERLEILYKELKEALNGTDLEDIHTSSDTIIINGKNYDIKDLTEIDKKIFEASISRLETELTILKKL